MTLNDALKLLGVPVGVGVADTKSAWAARVREAHPDQGGVPADSAERIKRLTAARDLLLAEIAGAGRACKACKGVGTVRGRLGAQDCTSCRGTGDRIG